ncbi:hypothetical protein E4P42_22540 [Mycobacterium sp. PS03-16]|uniref:hypothetical protein n=1 Tax=Mycobacterium sp. PS03-16 TaxID=2559611 RepID=UPI00107424DA|nr:hypothetical protein [Mycobacterium sp. PS03-16]TFV55508.1 hypothetical protein E4P42_22540 [Mycobacterium sp. PS03-16]
MIASLKPYVTTGVAIVGASVIAVAPLSPVTDDIRIHASTVSMDVQQAGLVEDLLTGISTVSSVTGNVIETLIDEVGDLPLNVVTAIAAAIENPELLPELLSALTYRILSPTTPGSFAGQLAQAIVPLTSLLPPDAQAAALEALGDLNAAIGELLDVLPNPTAGFIALQTALMDLPEFIYAVPAGIGSVVSGFGASISGAFDYFGGLPGLGALLVQAAIENPGDIPNLFSAAIYSVFNPFAPSLYSLTVSPIVNGFANAFGGPIGGLIDVGQDFVNDVIAEALSILPIPYFPSMNLRQMSTLAAGAAPAVPDADLEQVVEAFGTAAEAFLAGAVNAPERVINLVRAIAEDPASFASQIVAFVNESIDFARATIAPVGRAVIGTLPEAARGPIIEVGTAVDKATKDLQNAASGLVNGDDDADETDRSGSSGLDDEDPDTTTQRSSVTSSDDESLEGGDDADDGALSEDDADDSGSSGSGAGEESQGDESPSQSQSGGEESNGGQEGADNENAGGADQAAA